MTRLTRRSAVKLMAGAAVAMPYVKRARAEDAVLNVFNWADYIGETTLEDFTAKTGIQVTYDTYDSVEAMEAKMFAGNTGYDVVDQSGLGLPRFIKANVYEKLDKSKLPNFKNLDPEILRILDGWDPGNNYGIPYMWGTVGFTFNTDMVKERLPDADLTSLDTIFKPENAAKLADCGISILDSQGDVVPLLLKYLGKDPDTTNPADFGAVIELFKPIRQYIRTFDNANYLNAIPNGELCVINNWSGDYATARSRAEEAGVKINLEYHVPKTGSPAWVDVWCIPADAPHKENAYKFVDFMMEPEVIAKCTNFTNYANANLPANEFVDPAVLADPAVYPDAAIKERLWTPIPLTPELERAMTRAWSTIKTGSAG